MARPASEHPTALELEILKVLWESSPATVREIRESLASRFRDLAHTSVITTLNIMVGKGQLKRLEPETGKAYRYSPVLLQEDVSRGMLGDVVDRVFNGSAEKVMLSLMEISDLDSEEIKQLRRLFNRVVKEQQS